MVTLLSVTGRHYDDGHDVDERSYCVHSICCSLLSIFDRCVPTPGAVRLVTVGILHCRASSMFFCLIML